MNEWIFKKNDFGELLHQILGMLPIGFSCFERFYQKAEIDGNSYMMPVLEERVQTSIRKIDYLNSKVEQQTTQSNLVYIPFEDLVFFTFRKEANDKRGVSLLRQAYSDYLDKKELKRTGKKGITRSILGLPVGTVPTGTNPKSKSYESFMDQVIELGERNYQGTSDSAVMEEGYKIELLTAPFNLDQFKNYINLHDSSMLISVLTQFLLLGQNGNGGAFALGRDQSDTFLDGLQFIIDLIEEIYSRDVIQPAIRLNFADVDPFRFRLNGANLNKKASSEFATTLKSLVDSNGITFDPQDEVFLRKMYELPQVDLEERKKRQEEEQEKFQQQQDKIAESKPEEGKKEGAEEVKEEKEKLKLSEKTNFQNPKQRKAFQESEVKKLSKFSRASLGLIGDEFSRSIRKQLNKGTVQGQGLKDLQINNIGAYKKRLSQKLAGLSMDSWKGALRSSKGKIKLSEIKASDLPSKVLTAFVINQSDTIADKQINDIRELGILTANTESAKGLSNNNTMAIVDQKISDYIDNNRIDFGSHLATVQSMNFGEMEYYKSISDDLWGFRFANDEPVTAICKSLVGKTYQEGSSAMDIVQPPLHGRCDSFFIPIYKSESEEKTRA